MKKTFSSLIAIAISTVVFTQSTFTVHFDFNKHNLNNSAKARLDSFMEAQGTNIPSMLFQLKGHCDGIGSDAYNDALSRRRVIAVKNYFLALNIKSTQVEEEIGYGKRQPLNSNATDEERALNRRVEISFVHLPAGMPKPSIKETIADSAITSGTNIILNNINFVGGRHQFLPESESALKELLDAMRVYPALVIQVEGHICCQFGPGDGVDLETGISNLSEARAKAVMDYLVENGIDQKRVSYKGFGHSAPIYPFPERTEEEQKLNRRVEIKIISK